MPRFIGHFNFQGELHHFTVSARNRDQAYMIMLSVLSKKLSLARRALMYHFNGEKDNYRILEEPKK